MIFLNLLILGVYLVLFLFCRQEHVGKDVKSYLRPFCKIANSMLRIKKVQKLYSPKVKENLRELYPPMQTERRNKEYYSEKFSLILLILFAGNLLVLCLQGSSLLNATLTEDGKVWRNTYGEGEIPLDLEVRTEDGQQNITYNIQERKYDTKGIEAVFDRIQAEIETIILGENQDLEHVTRNLNLPAEIPEFPVNIEWECNNYSYLGNDGQVFNEEIEAETPVKLTMILSYEEYRREYEFFVVILPKQRTEGEEMQRAVLQALSEEDKSQETQESFLMPTEITNGSKKEKVYFREIKKDDSYQLFGIVLISCLMLTVLKDRDLQKRVVEKRKNLLLEYPGFVCKLSLLTGAGMTVKNAIIRIVSDYQREKKEGGKKKYVYEELLITVNEMENGIFEEKAYENFGKRCKVQQYTKLSVLLVQNMKKGSGDLRRALEAETSEAFEIRKSNARRLGEEAGTKLLLPMMLMLGIVMVLIIVPAFLSYQL